MNIILIIYVMAYLFTWKSFLDVPGLSFLMPFAIIWILSAFICLFLSKRKRQIPFLAFFLGSIFGPGGIIILCLSPTDLRSVQRGNRDIKFYADFENQINKLRVRIFKYDELAVSEILFGQFRRWILYNQCQTLAEAVGCRLNFPNNVISISVSYKLFLTKLDEIEECLKSEKAQA